MPLWTSAAFLVDAERLTREKPVKLSGELAAAFNNGATACGLRHICPRGRPSNSHPQPVRAAAPGIRPRKAADAALQSLRRQDASPDTPCRLVCPIARCALPVCVGHAPRVGISGHCEIGPGDLLPSLGPGFVGKIGRGLHKQQFGVDCVVRLDQRIELGPQLIGCRLAGDRPRARTAWRIAEPSGWAPCGIARIGRALRAPAPRASWSVCGRSGASVSKAWTWPSETTASPSRCRAPPWQPVSECLRKARDLGLRFGPAACADRGEDPPQLRGTLTTATGGGSLPAGRSSPAAQGRPLPSAHYWVAPSASAFRVPAP